MTNASQKDQATSSPQELKLEAMDLLSALETKSLSDEQRSDLQNDINQWKSRSKEHLHAWQAAEEMWQLMANMAEPATVQPIKRKKSYFQKRYIFPVSLAASLAVMAVVMLLPKHHHAEHEVALASKKTVEQVIEKKYSNQWQTKYRVLLPDASVVYLNFNSTINVKYSQSERLIELEQGEALFQVAKNPNKPFIVRADDTNASALGTAFIVKRQSENASLITVTEGIVKVAKKENEHDEQSIILSVDESINSSEISHQAIKKVDSKTVTAWHKGVLIFKDQPLEHVLAEIDRYTPYTINANLGYRSTEKITGTFFIQRLDEELSSLITSLNLAVVSNKGDSVTLGLAPPVFN